jgi:CIC family chloride channel protein
MWLQPAVGGLAVGIMALFVPEVLGVGYDYVDRVLGGDLALKTLILLAVLKIVATAVCYSSGNAGGIFGPSLFIGAMIGGVVGSVAHHFFPGSTAGPGAYALVGMGTAFAGIVRTPLTSVIMIFEMTRDYSIIVPLMISNLISFMVSYRLQRQPIYEALAHQEGVTLPSNELREQVSRLQIGKIMRAPQHILSPDDTLKSAGAAMSLANVKAIPVADEGSLWGVLKLSQIDGHSGSDQPIRDVLTPNGSFAFVYTDESLSLALERMGSAGVDSLPVVSRANVRQLLGMITLPEVLAAYGLHGGQS